MSSNLLSPIHIQKLGHPIEEIRTRALHSVTSKYDLQLVDDSNFINTKLLLDKLLNWFSFETYSHEEKVFSLIIKILKQENKKLKEVDYKWLLDKVDNIKRCIDERYLASLQEVNDCIKNLRQRRVQLESEENNQALILSDNQGDIKSKESLNVENLREHSSGCNGVITNSVNNSEMKSSDNFLICKLNKISENIKECHDRKTFSTKKELTNEIFFMVEYFTWQPLVSTDSYIFSSLYEGLRYIDNTSSILESCQFYTDILLKDFPPQIFVQRPLLVHTFLELLQCEELKVCFPAATCLIALVKSLQAYCKYVLEISWIHSKNYFQNCFTHKKPQTTQDSDSGRDDLQRQLNLDLHLSESETEMERDEDILGIKCHQYSVPQFCYSVLTQAIPCLSTGKSRQKHNLMCELVLETFTLLNQNITPVFWCGKNQLKERLQKVLNLFHDALTHLKNDTISHSIVVYIVVKILTDICAPAEQLQELLPDSLQLDIAECVSNCNFIFLSSSLHSKILFLVEKFSGQGKMKILEDYNVSLELCKSMGSAIEFLKHCCKKKTKLETLTLVKSALPSLDFHRKFQFITDFINNCLMKWSTQKLSEEESLLRKSILLKLLAHADEEVKTTIYKELHSRVIKHLGVEEAEKQKFQFPGNKFEFLFDSDVLTEMICHGCNSSQNEIRSFGREIFVHILKGKFLMSSKLWEQFMKSIIPCFPLLQCFADKSTSLGRCIVKIFDPDISESILLSPLDLIKGNLRLLFSRVHLIREEALSRLFWLLTKEDPEKKKLPRLSLLRGINLSSVCCSVTPEDYSRMKQFYSVGSLCNVMDMLHAKSLEPSVRRSALTQISVMLEDCHLHCSFLEQNGLETILNIFENCLLEKEFQNYPDSVVPIMNILKLLCLHNSTVRLKLSQNTDVLYCILRGLLLFSSERQSRQNGAELLCLLLFNEFIINVHNETTITHKISLPEIVVTKMCLPLLAHVHWKFSRHYEASIRESIMLRENSSRLLRIYWNTEWMGGLSKTLFVKNDGIKDGYSPSVPTDMILKAEDLALLKTCSIEFGMKKTLHDIQNATTHESVISSLHHLNSYIMLYHMETQMDDVKEITANLLKLPWEYTFERFLLLTPTSEEDEVLLFQVVRIVRLLLKTFKSEKLMTWVEKLLTDKSATLPNVVKSYGKQCCGLMRRNVTFAVIELMEETISKTSEQSMEVWHFYIDMVTELLHLNRASENSNVAHTDLLISLLVDLTGRSSGGIKCDVKVYERTITRVVEVIIAVHCTKDSQNSFLGVNVMKNCLKVLNHFLADGRATIKGWEQLWRYALSKVSGHNDQPNYCWLMSLWYHRDSVIRALTVQLLSGFSLTCRACDLLIHQLHIEFEYLWREGFNFLLDVNECNAVREKAALLLSNLTCHGSMITATEFYQDFMDINFYETILGLTESLSLRPTLRYVADSHIIAQYYGRSIDEFSGALMLSTPQLVNAISILLLNIMFLNPEQVGETILKTALLETLTKIFWDGPEACEKYKNEDFVSEIMKMYASVGIVIRKCVKTVPAAYSFILQSQQFVNSLYCLMNYSLYNVSSKVMVDERNKLWCEILDLLSVLLAGPVDPANEDGSIQNEGFKSLSHAITENGTDYFISSLYLAATSYSCELRFCALQFLTNLFGHEARRLSCPTISDILDRPIFSEAVDQAQALCMKGFVICRKSDLTFETRICDILLQSYRLCNQSDKSGFKARVTDALGNLFIICRNAQIFCADQGLANDITNSLQSAFVKLSIFHTDCFRKVADRKKIDPVLVEVETLYRLMTNLFFRNEKIKIYVADLGLPILVHKLWPWCDAKISLLITALKMLCTFTLNCEPAARSLIMNKWSITGFRKSPGSATLFNVIMQLTEKEMDLISKNYQSEIVRLLFQLLENCCKVTECRSVLSKGSLIPSFKNSCHSILNRKRVYNDEIVETWFNFLIIFTAHQEGQLTLARNQELLDVIITSSTALNRSQRIKALTILRNTSCHQLNRIQLLGHYQFLSAMLQALKCGETEGIALALHTIWTLTYNSQKGKVIIRNAGFEESIKEVKKKLILTDLGTSFSVADTVLQILQNK